MVVLYFRVSLVVGEIEGGGKETVEESVVLIFGVGMGSIGRRKRVI